MRKNKGTAAKRAAKIAAVALTVMLSIPMCALADQSGVVTANTVNVRSGASKTTQAVTTVSKDASVTIKGSEKDTDGNLWYQIDYNGTSGYIMATYVKVSDSSTTTTTTTTTTGDNAAAASSAASTENTNTEAAAAASSTASTENKTENTAEASNTTTTTTTAAATTNTAAATTNTAATTTTKAPAADSPAATNATKSSSTGTSVVTDVANGELPAGVTAMDPTTLSVKANNTNLRSQASTSSGKVVSLSSGSNLTAYGTITGNDSKTWYYAIVDGTGNSQGGYIREDVVTVGSVVATAAVSAGTETVAASEETAETQTEVATGPVTAYGDADYEIVYEVDETGAEIPYFYDNVDGKKVKIQELLTYVTEKGQENDKAAAQIRNLKIICIVLGVIAAILAVLLIVMKVREGYDDDDYADGGYGGPVPARNNGGQRDSRGAADDRRAPRRAGENGGGADRGRGAAAPKPRRQAAQGDSYDRDENTDRRAQARPREDARAREDGARKAAPVRSPERGQADQGDRRGRAPKRTREGGDRYDEPARQQGNGPRPVRRNDGAPDRAPRREAPDNSRRKPVEEPDDDLAYEFLDLDGDKNNN